MTICLSPFDYCSNVPQIVWFIINKSISYSSGDWEIQDSVLVKAHFRSIDGAFLLFPHVVEEANLLSGVFYKVATPVTRALLS